MKTAIALSADGKHRPITAGPGAPQEAACPACGADVQLRKRTKMDSHATYYYRHKNGQGKNCPRRSMFNA